MEKKYNVGDKVWWADCGTRQVRKDCPVCFGRLEVTLLLGNGEAVILPCDYCGKGFDGPRGYTVEYEYVAEPKEIFIREVRTVDRGAEATHEYFTTEGYPSYNYILYIDDIFDTEQEARERCRERIRKYEEEQFNQIECIKAQKHKSFSWNAGYHMREVKRAKRQVEYHEKMARICKERSR